MSATGPSWVTRTTLTSEITAPAERSSPPARMTMVSPSAASARVAALALMLLMSKYAMPWPVMSWSAIMVAANTAMAMIVPRWRDQLNGGR